MAAGGLRVVAQLQEDGMQYLKGFQLFRYGQVTKKYSIYNTLAPWHLGCVDL